MRFSIEDDIQMEEGKAFENQVTSLDKDWKYLAS
jgi:hypothetical protein